MQQLSLSQGIDVLTALRDHSAGKSTDELSFVNFCVNNLGWSTGQHLQDLWVAYEMKSRRGGYFVEFGAMDGVIFSNSCSLERHLGWNGIVAEPAHLWHPALSNNRACYVDSRCVWTKTGETLVFNQTPLSGLSTIDSFSSSDAHADHRRDGLRYDVETVSLIDLLTHWRAPRRIDYLSIDTEGSEFDILSTFDWSTHEFRLITVEHNHTAQRDRIFDLLSPMGYQRKFEALSHADDWYVKTY